MNRQYWAERGTFKLGPYGDRKTALKAFRKTFPIIGDYWGGDYIMTGYGAAGAIFDIRWHSAR